MTLKRDKLIVVDIEATCWRTSPPPGQQNEIIEIGVCQLDCTSGTISGVRSILVKLGRSKVSAFCTKLTTLTQAQVDEGMTFADACLILENDYEAPARLWGSWGDYDRKMFEKQCPSFGVRYPFSERHVNVKALFAQLNNQDKQVGMARALKMIDLSLEGIHHRGDDDARNIARIAAHLLTTHGMTILESYWQEESQ